MVIILGGHRTGSSRTCCACLLVRSVAPNILAHVGVQSLRERFHEPVRQRLTNQKREGRVIVGEGSHVKETNIYENSKACFFGAALSLTYCASTNGLIYKLKHGSTTGVTYLWHVLYKHSQYEPSTYRRSIASNTLLYSLLLAPSLLLPHGRSLTSAKFIS